MIAVYEATAATVRPAKVACVALNCKGLSPDQARQAIDTTEDETGLPVGDVFAGDGPKLWAAVESLFS
jgi:uncharacterized NAD-dependent epimerase/dehydratase family protein